MPQGGLPSFHHKANGFPLPQGTAAPPAETGSINLVKKIMIKIIKLHITRL
jgi:hypothetical protein